MQNCPKPLEGYAKIEVSPFSNLLSVPVGPESGGDPGGPTNIANILWPTGRIPGTFEDPGRPQAHHVPLPALPRAPGVPDAPCAPQRSPRGAPQCSPVRPARPGGSRLSRCSRRSPVLPVLPALPGALRRSRRSPVHSLPVAPRSPLAGRAGTRRFLLNLPLRAGGGPGSWKGPGKA